MFASRMHARAGRALLASSLVARPPPRLPASLRLVGTLARASGTVPFGSERTGPSAPPAAPWLSRVLACGFVSLTALAAFQSRAQAAQQPSSDDATPAKAHCAPKATVTCDTPDQLFDYDVYISHASDWTSLAIQIAKRLRADGLRVWLFEDMVPAGDDVEVSMKEGLSESKTLLFLSSESSAKSPWIALELNVFANERPNGFRRRIIPLKLDKSTPPDTVPWLSGVYRLDCQNKVLDDYYADLLKAVKRCTNLKSPRDSSTPAAEGEHDDELNWQRGQASVRSEHYDIFLSHAGEQKREVVSFLYEELVSRGFRVFVDYTDLARDFPGVSNEIIMDKVSDCASVGLFVMSNSFVGKRWPLHELRQFYRRECADDLVRLIPIFYTEGIFNAGKDHPEWLSGSSAKELFQAISGYNGIEKFTGDFDERLIRRVADMATKAAIDIDIARARRKLATPKGPGRSSPATVSNIPDDELVFCRGSDVEQPNRLRKLSRIAMFDTVGAKSSQVTDVLKTVVTNLRIHKDDANATTARDPAFAGPTATKDSAPTDPTSANTGLSANTAHNTAPASPAAKETTGHGAAASSNPTANETTARAAAPSGPAPIETMARAAAPSGPAANKNTAPGASVSAEATASGKTARARAPTCPSVSVTDKARITAAPPPSIVWRASGATLEDLATSLAPLAELLGIEAFDTLRATETHRNSFKLKIRRVLSVLRSWPAPWVLHIDDCKIDLTDLDEVLGPPGALVGAPCAVIVTSRLPQKYFEAVYHWRLPPPSVADVKKQA